MLFMVIERYRHGDPRPVYERFHRSGRLAPAGLTYLSSWVNEALDTCYQVMETSDPALLQQWIAQWSDLVDFDAFPVITSAEAATRVLALDAGIDTGTPGEAYARHAADSLRSPLMSDVRRASAPSRFPQRARRTG